MARVLVVGPQGRRNICPRKKKPYLLHAAEEYSTLILIGDQTRRTTSHVRMHTCLKRIDLRRTLARSLARSRPNHASAEGETTSQREDENDPSLPEILY